MMITDKIPDLQGWICEDLFSCEMYVAGKHIGNFGLLIKVMNGDWHYVFFDYGPLFWNQWDEFPVVDTTMDSPRHYPFVEVGNQLQVAGQVIEWVETAERDSVKEIIFKFDNGVQVKHWTDSHTWERQFVDYRNSEEAEWMRLDVG